MKQKNAKLKRNVKAGRSPVLLIPVILVIAIAVAIFAYQQFVKNGIENVDAQSVQSLMNEGVEVIDVRTPGEYSTGHIPKAKLIPLNQLPGAIREGELDPSKPYIVVCASGNRSLQAAQFLTSKGFEKIYNFEGGMLKWPGPEEK